MISVNKATRNSIKVFDSVEWNSVDIEHYGATVEWIDKNFLFSATENNQTLGYIEGKLESGILNINTLIVGKDYRREGVGKMLMEKAEDWGKKQGAHKSHLQTGKGWKAEKFYESLGYKHIVDLLDHHFHRIFVIYEKKL